MMAGGLYDHLYLKVAELASKIDDDLLLLATPGYTGGEPLPDDVISFMMILSRDLKKLSRQSHNLEWYRSGDWTLETFRQSNMKRKAIPVVVKIPDPIDPSLTEIIGEKGSQTNIRYWKMMKVWPAEKNHSPKLTAQAWVRACEKEDPKTIYCAALAYRDCFLPPKRKKDETQFMKSPLVWLKEEGWHSTEEEP